MSEAEDKIGIVRRWFEGVWNDRRADLIDELVTCDSVCHLDEDAIRGPEEFKQRQYGPFLSAFPDLRVVIEGTIAQGDDVVIRWRARGTHTGNGLGFPATQREASFQGMTWVHVQDGRLMEGWQSSNIPEVLRNLSAPTPA